MKHTERKTWIARCLFLIAACAIVLLAAKWVEKAQSFDDAEGGYLPGTYAAEANGFGGDVTVTVTVGDKGGISNVDIQGPGETRDVVSAAELAQPGSYAYIIFDQHLRDSLKAIEKYVSTGITVQADTIEGLAEQIGVDGATLAETLANWNQYVANQNDPDFGRESGMDADLSQAPYYAIKIAPGIHHTMGGVNIDTGAEVLDTNGNPIPGLFAAGEVTGGVHGGNRLGGNAVADFVVFGRIAGEQAAEYVK